MQEGKPKWLEDRERELKNLEKKAEEAREVIDSLRKQIENCVAELCFVEDLEKRETTKGRRTKFADFLEEMRKKLKEKKRVLEQSLDELMEGREKLNNFRKYVKEAQGKFC